MSQRMVRSAAAERSGSHDERAIGYGISHVLVLFRTRQERGSTHGGTRLPERNFVGIHNTQAGKTEVAHGASRRSDVERVACGHQDDAQTVEFRWSKQDAYSKTETHRQSLQGAGNGAELSSIEREVRQHFAVP